MTADDPTSPTFRVNLLLVDDQAFIGDAIRLAVASEPDIKFHYCSRAADAPALAASLRPTVILQDLAMPDADGLALVRAYRADPATADVPVIALSVREDSALKVAAFSAGAHDYLVKLPDRVELLARIRYHSAACLAQRRLVALNQSLEAATRAKSEFLAMMSHEVRTPLNGVLGFSDLLLETALTPAQRGYAETIAASGRALLTVVNDILDFSKIEAGKLEIETTTFHLARAVRTTLELFAPRARERGNALVSSLSPALPALIASDEVRFQQVLGNLVSNAIKFTTSGRITIDVRPGDPAELARHSAPGTEPPASRPLLRVSVRDTGPGVPPEKRDRLFHAYDQLSTGQARAHGGTGLGLTICRQLTRLLGGDIWFVAPDGGGSEFVFTISYATADATHLEPAPETPAASDLARMAGARALIAEDNAVNAKLIATLLHRYGISAATARDGGEAVETATRDGAYDLIFMDLQMPRLDGLEATRRIRTAEAAGRPRAYIIALTADAMRGDREKCAAAGMDDYLTKPLRRADLAAALERFTQHQQPNQTS